MTQMDLRAIAERAPREKYKDIARDLGFSAWSVARAAKRIGVQHDDDTLRNIAMEHVRKMSTREAVERSRVKRLHLYKMDKWLAMQGKNPITRKKLTLTPLKMRRAISSLKRLYDYFSIDGEDPCELFYDGQTRRRIGNKNFNEDYYEKRYGIKFTEADD